MLAEGLRQEGTLRLELRAFTLFFSIRASGVLRSAPESCLHSSDRSGQQQNLSALKLCLKLSYLLVFDPILLLKVSNVGPGFLLSFFDSFLSALAASKLAILWRKAGKRRCLLLSLNGSARKGSYRAGRTIVTSGEYPLVAWVLSCQPVRHSRPPTIGVARSSGLTHVQS